MDKKGLIRSKNNKEALDGGKSTCNHNTQSSSNSLHQRKESSSCGSCGVCGMLRSPHPASEIVSQALSRAKALGKETCAVSFMQRNHGNQFTVQAVNHPALQTLSHKASQENKPLTNGSKQGLPGEIPSQKGSGQGLRSSTEPGIPAVQRGPAIQRKCACGGSCPSCAGKGEEEEEEEKGIQAKLTVGSANDIYEQEADSVAAKVVSMSAPSAEKRIRLSIQRVAQGEANAGHGNVSLSYSGGDNLSHEVRGFMESRFGVDFSGVTIHKDSAAQQNASELNARAFTYGNHIWLGRGESEQDKSLMAHELTHVVQQSTVDCVQCDLVVPPTTPNRAVHNLSAAEIQAAITYNQARHKDAKEIALIRDILGLSPNPAVIDQDFILAVVQYQAQYGLARDGKIGGGTGEKIGREIIAEANYLRPGNLGTLAHEFQLKTNLELLVNASNKTYVDYKNAIQAGTMIQRLIVLQDHAFLRRIQALLTWDDFAKCIELLGKMTPSGSQMLQNRNVRVAMNAAWAASSPAVTIWPAHDPAPALAGNPCNPPAGAPPAGGAAHEEGGFIYMNLITGNLTTLAVVRGGQANLPLSNPTLVADSIVVGGYHTHPNVGACWGAPFFSTADQNWANTNGVPILMIGAFPALANTSTHSDGPRRTHLAGNRGLPGAGGGIAPQSPLNGLYDEV